MPKVTWKQGGFSKGMVLNRDPRDLGPGESPYLLNMYLRNGTLRTIPRPKRVWPVYNFRELPFGTHPPLGTGIIASVRPLGMIDNTPVFAVAEEPAAGSTDFYHQNVFIVRMTQIASVWSGPPGFEGVVSSFADPAGSSYYVSRRNAVEWGICVGDSGGAAMIVAARRYNATTVWFELHNVTTGITLGYASAVTAPWVSDLVYHQSHYWHVNGTAPGAVRVSEAGGIATPESNTYYVGNPGERITKLFPYDDNLLLVFKEYSIWAIRGTPGTDAISVDLVTDKIGCAFPATIKRLWGSSVLAFVSTDGRIVVMPSMGAIQYVATQVTQEQILALAKCTQESTATALPYAAVNHLGHYILSATDINGTSGGKTLRGFLFDTTREWWASYFDLNCDENTVYPRYICDSQLLLRQYGDITPVPAQTVWGSTGSMDTLSTLGFVPELIFGEQDIDDEVYGKWAVHSRKIAFPDGQRFVIGGARADAGVVKTRSTVLLSRFDNDSILSVSGYPLDMKIHVSATPTKGGRFTCSVAHPGTASTNVGISAGSLSVDCEQCQTFECYVSIKPYRGLLPDVTKFTVSLYLNGGLVGSYAYVTGYDRVKVSFDNGAKFGTTVTSAALWVGTGATEVDPFDFVVEDLRAVLPEEDSSHLGKVAVAYEVSPLGKDYVTAAPSPRLMNFKPATVYASDRGGASEFKKSRLPAWTKHQLRDAMLCLSDEKKITSNAYPVSSIVENPRYMDFYYEAIDDITGGGGHLDRGTPRSMTLVPGSVGTHYAYPSSGVMTISGCGADPQAFYKAQSANGYPFWMFLRTYAAASAPKFLNQFGIGLVNMSVSPFLSGGLTGYSYRSGSDQIYEFDWDGVNVLTHNAGGGLSYHTILIRIDFRPAGVGKIWIDETLRATFTTKAVAGSLFAIYGKMSGTLNSNVTHYLTSLRFNVGDIKLPTEVFSFRDLEADLWTPEFINARTSQDE